MGNDLAKGTTYVDGGTINAANLNAHVEDAVFKSTCISARTLKNPMAVTDELLINDSGVLKKVTGIALYDMTTQPGAVIQSTYAQQTGWVSSTSVIPFDSTTPQIWEGVELMSLSFTPRFANSRMMLRCSGYSTMGATGISAIAAFRDAAADSIGAIVFSVAGANTMINWVLMAVDLPASAATVTYSIRSGPCAAGAIYHNGNTAGGAFGGAGGTTLEVQEIRIY